MDVKLLQFLPTINDGQLPIPLKGYSLDALVYMSHQRQEKYQRDQLIQVLWGSYDNITQKKFTNLLFNLPDIIKEKVITANNQIIFFHRDNVEVDTAIFNEYAQSVLTKNYDYRTVDTIQTALQVYQSHFLQGYFPQVDGLVPWREEQQLEMDHKRNMLLELMVRLQIQYANLSEAKRYALEWLKSLNPTYIPLQYLIWITANQSGGIHIELDGYLSQLSDYESANTIHMGPTHQEWRYYLREYDVLPAWLLRLHATSTIEISRQDISTQTEIIGRQTLIKQILQLLLSDSEKRLVALTGKRGVGKSTVLNAVVNIITDTPGMPEPIRLNLTNRSTFITLLDDIVKQFDNPNLMLLDFASKKKQSQYILQSRLYVVIIDDYKGNNPSGVIDELVDYIGRTALLLAIPLLEDVRFQNIEVQGFELDDVREVLARFGVQGITTSQIEEFIDLTDGLPLLLIISLSFLRHRKIDRFSELLALLRYATDDAPDSNEVATKFQGVLVKLIERITPSDRYVLRLIAMFDPLYGVSINELAGSRKISLDLKRLQQKLDLLTDLSLVQENKTHSDYESIHKRFSVHPFVRHILLPEKSDEISTELVSDFVSIVFHYVESYQNDFVQLDQYQENILGVLELLQDQPVLYCSLEMYAQFVKLIYYYLERRGFYEISIDILLRTIEFGDNCSTVTQLELHHMLGQAYSRQSNQAFAEKYLKDALKIAQTVEGNDYFAAIHLDLALLDLHSQRLEEAEKRLTHAYDLASAENQRLLICRILINLGTCAHRQGNYSKAEKHYREILEHVQAIPHESQDYTQISFSAYKGLGIILGNLGQLREAKQCYDEASLLVEQLNDPIRTAYLLLSMGGLNYLQGEYDEAHNNFLRGKTLVEAFGHSEGITLFYLNLGFIQAARHQFVDSETNLRWALLKAEEFDIEWIKAEIHNTLGKLYLRQSLINKTEDHFKRAIQKAGPRSKIISEALYGLVLNRMLAEFTVGSNEIEDARRFVQLIIQTCELNTSLFQVISEETVWAAHQSFVQDFAEFPELQRYYIVEALLEWIDRN